MYLPVSASATARASESAREMELVESLVLELVPALVSVLGLESGLEWAPVSVLALEQASRGLVRHQVWPELGSRVSVQPRSLA